MSSSERNKIIIFTLALRDDNINKTIDSPLHKLCINTWHKIVDYLKLKGYEAEIIIYNDDSEEFKFVWNDCFTHARPGHKSHIADAFRIYILSQKPRSLWLDWDIYVRDNFEFDFEKPLLFKSWYMIYNCDDISMFKKIYEFYKRNGCLRFQDMDICNLLEERKEINYKFDKPFRKYVIHCGFIDDQPVGKLHFINEDDEKTSFVLDHIKLAKEYTFINPNTDRHGSFYGLLKEKELINFILKNYNLSEEQIKKLLE